MINNLVLLQADGGQGAGAMNLIMIVVLIAIFYFFMIRPQQKKQKEIRKFRERISVGDNIVTAGGIYGRIRRIKETTFVVEISKGVEITVDKGSVYPSAADVQMDTSNKIEDAK
ncbi:preprotein translocase subunit YajC [Muribaculaceae bacterium Isolate-104 (HZI)]|jgi:preprotein translocase subunit YajC|nr:preprotein translocase subunit YajC [Muribaculaceae bacterium Isolate-104 (HZI)]